MWPARAWQSIAARKIAKLAHYVYKTLCIAISLTVNGALPFFSAILLGRLLAYNFLFADSIQCLCLIIDAWQLQPWRKVILTTARG